MDKQPNIIMLVMDSVRVDRLSCYGYHRNTTPHIDRISKDSTLYEQAISVGCWTVPVHASIFTGLYPSSHGLTISKDALPANYPTLAYQLKNLGYQTACFSNNAYISDITGLAQGFDTVEDIWRVSKPRGIQRTKMGKLIQQLKRLGPIGIPVIRLARLIQELRSVLKRRNKQGDMGAELTNERIQTWLNESWNSDHPFFIFINYMEPHEPYNPPQPYNRIFIPKRYSTWRVARVGNNKNVSERIDEKRGKEDLEILNALYDGELNYLDQKIGELVDFLEKRDILENTMLILTSDHGDCLGEHHLIGHRMALYEQLVHVPLIIRLPERFQPGTRVTQQVSLVDLYPTILESAGAVVEESKFNGYRSLLSTPDDTVRTFMVAENTAPKSLESVVSRMIRTTKLKYIWKSNQEHELYNLIDDPGESLNLFSNESRWAQEMHEKLESWLHSIDDHKIEVGEATYDQMMVERLRELGYVE
jgi:arylsulfatase A-like enzyme